jgi:hypothetical protein
MVCLVPYTNDISNHEREKVTATDYTTIKLNQDQMKALFYALHNGGELARTSEIEHIEAFDDRYDEIYAKLRKSGWDC